MANSEDPEYGKSAYEDDSKKAMGYDPRPGNFPPWMCTDKCKCCHHDIGKEIPSGPIRGVVYRAYILWYVSLIMYVANLAAEGYRVKLKIANSTIDLIAAILFLVLIWPATLFIYLLLYGAARNVGKSWMWWWLLGGLQICVELFFSIGVPKTGASGLVTMIQTFKAKQKEAGFAQLAAFFGWVFLFLFHLVDYIIAWRYRSGVEGGYIKQKASEEYYGDEHKAQDKSYTPPPIVESSSSTSVSSYGSNPSSTNPSWYQPSGSAYEAQKPSDSTTYTPNPSSNAQKSSNPFGADNGSLDSFYD